MILLKMLVFVFLPAIAFGAPSVGGISGTVSEGQLITISGSGFGTGPVNVVWLGGASGAIESAAAGQLPYGSGNWAGWDGDTDTESSEAPEISTDQAHSGNQSIWSHVSGDKYGSGFWVDWQAKFGTNYGEIFISYWVRWAESGAEPPYQWKRVRFKLDNIDEYSIYQDHVGQLYHNYFANSTSWSDMNFKEGLEHTDWCADCGDERYDDWVEGEIPQEEWAREDFYIRPETEDSVNDGTFIHDVFIPNSARYAAHNVNANADIGTTLRRYIIFQNYFGNLEAGTKNADFYIDDIYMADSPARVEVCSEAAWSDRRRCEIQPSESWTSNSITVRVNQSSFAPSEPVYLYVVDASGAVNSAGYALSFGSSAANGAAESGGGGGGGGGGCFINSIIP